jgi:hypothetical protein
VELIVEGMMLAAAARVAASSRAPVLARPRRGAADLGDRDPTPRRARERPEVVETLEPGHEPWVTGAACTAIVVTVGIAVRGALALV